MCSPLLLGLHLCEEAAAHHLHPLVPPASLRAAPAVRTLPGLVHGVWRPQLIRAVGAAAVVCWLGAAGGVSAGRTGIIRESWSDRSVKSVVLYQESILLYLDLGSWAGLFTAPFGEEGSSGMEAGVEATVAEEDVPEAGLVAWFFSDLPEPGGVA